MGLSSGTIPPFGYSFTPLLFYPERSQTETTRKPGLRRVGTTTLLLSLASLTALCTTPRRGSLTRLCQTPGLSPEKIWATPFAVSLSPLLITIDPRSRAEKF
ncbi:hypothetical protein THTE_1247 [Thermogutta terrifontis]|uniref:Uncharacterized protein n=1 Tax=Thermogutta terrifontis TaxID=1331910 RepID=A0A286RD20_9BACT|nr:hypothetical protein THTE_1247 [Thermogutta terrifontis]